jgi:hypothetical protein
LFAVRSLSSKANGNSEVKAMSLVIPDEFLQTAHISAADLKLEIALLRAQPASLQV